MTDDRAMRICLWICKNGLIAANPHFGLGWRDKLAYGHGFTELLLLLIVRCGAARSLLYDLQRSSKLANQVRKLFKRVQCAAGGKARARL